MIVNEHNSMPYMRCLTSCLNRIVQEGYTESFRITEQGLESNSKHYNYKPEEIEIINFFRFEGESDPADNAILYVIETNDGLKGTLIDSYGVYSDLQLSKFIKDIELKKKNTRN